MDIPDEVTITPDRRISGDVGGSGLSLKCSVNITTDPFPPDVPPPFFTWLFAPLNHTSLPKLTPLQNSTVSPDNNSHIYTSTLKFLPLLVSHAGMYICQLRGNERLIANTTVIVNGIL